MMHTVSKYTLQAIRQTDHPKPMASLPSLSILFLPGRERIAMGDLTSCSRIIAGKLGVFHLQAKRLTGYKHSSSYSCMGCWYF